MVDRMIEKQLGQGEKFVRISLEDCCQWPTMGRNACRLRCAEKHVSVLSRALMNKRSETIKDAMIDMQLLLHGGWRFDKW